MTAPSRSRAPLVACSLLSLLASACMSSAYSPSLPPTPPLPDSGVEPMPHPPSHAPPSSPPPATPPPFDPVRIAAGATAAYTDPAGHVWSADAGFIGGVTSVTTMPVAIAGTDAAPLYNAERYGDAGAGFSYGIVVPNGSYLVRLGFAETYLQAAGQRLFDVTINGQKVLAAFDIFAAAGGMNRAVVESFPVTVSTGTVALSFTAGAVQNAKINTIEIDAQMP